MVRKNDTLFIQRGINMTEEEIKQFIGQTEDDLITAKKFLAMWQRRNQTPSLNRTQELQLNGTGDEKEHGKIADDVRAAIARCSPHGFTIDDIESALLSMNKRISRTKIAQSVSRLIRAKKPIIGVQERGRGRKAARYETK